MLGVGTTGLTLDPKPDLQSFIDIYSMIKLWSAWHSHVDTKLTWTHADHSLVDRRNAMPGVNGKHMGSCR